MKSTPWLALALTLFSFVGHGQVSPPSNSSEAVLVETGPNQQVWHAVTVDEQGQTNVNSVTAIATGMNYWDGQQWVPSDPSFDVTEDAFVATRLQHKVRLGADLNTIGAVTVTTRDGITLHSTPVGIGVYDAASGRSAI